MKATLAREFVNVVNSKVKNDETIKNIGETGEVSYFQEDSRSLIKNGQFDDDDELNEFVADLNPRKNAGGVSLSQA